MNHELDQNKVQTLVTIFNIKRSGQSLYKSRINVWHQHMSRGYNNTEYFKTNIGLEWDSLYILPFFLLFAYVVATNGLASQWFKLCMS